MSPRLTTLIPFNSLSLSALLIPVIKHVLAVPRHNQSYSLSERPWSHDCELVIGGM